MNKYIREKQRVIFVLPSARAGGAERVLINLLNRIDRDRFELSLILVDAFGPYLSSVRKDIKIHDIGTNKVRKAIPKLIPLIRKLSPDVLLSSIGHLNLALLLSRPFMPRRTRICVRESNVPSMSFSESFKLRLYGHLYPFLYSRADVVICPGEGIKRDLRDNFRILEEKIVTIPNPVEAEEIWKNRELYSNPYKHNVANLVAAGSLTRQKGFDLLIKAFAAVKRHFGSINLTIMGEGPEARNLMTLTSTLGVEDSVLFPGLQRNPYPYFFHADLFVLASRWEGLPNVVLESLACGTPVVAFECKGCVSEIFDNTSQGVLVPPGDIEALEKTIISWLEGHRSANKRPFLPKRFYPEEVVRQYEHILESR